MDAFVVAPVSVLRAPAGRHPRDILPGCRTMIIFGTEIPDPFFAGTSREKKSAARQILNSLESTAVSLKNQLEQDGYPSVAILPSLPLKAEHGLVRGILSLKHCARDAGFGTIGDNSLLIHPVFGNCLALGAVITEMEIDPTPAFARLPECTRCNRCAESCPGGAIHDGVVDITACRNLRDYAGPFIPLVKFVLKGGWSSRVMMSLVNRVGGMIEAGASCSACVVSCPYFHKGKR
jgi:epoxyqueuosine reductase QueG